MEEPKKTPEIRFKGSNNKWQQHKLGEIFETVTDYVAAGSFADLAANVVYKDAPDYAQLVRTTDLKNGFKNSSSVYVDKKAFNYLYRVNLDKECVILPNIGNCGEVYYVTPNILPYENNVLGPNAILLRSNKFNNAFLSILLQGEEFQKNLSLIISPNGQTKFNKTELKQISLSMLENNDEQAQVGKIFQNFDNLIVSQQQKYNSLCNTKKSMLQKMFPQGDDRIPEVRFKGFDGKWEEKKVADIADVYDGTHQTPDYKDEGIMFLSVEDISTLKSTKYISEEAFKRDFKIFPKRGDVFMTRIGDVGTSNVVISNERLSYYVSLALLKPKNIDSWFLNYVISSSKFKKDLKLRTLVTAVPQKINKDEIGKINFFLPTDINEQKQIGKYFMNLDNLISQQQQKLEKLKNIKSAMLEKMLV